MVRTPHWGRQRPCDLAVPLSTQPAQRDAEDGTRPFAGVRERLGGAGWVALSFLLSVFLLKRYILCPQFLGGPRVCAWLCTTSSLGQDSPLFTLFFSSSEYFIHPSAVCSGDAVCICR